MNDAVRRSLLAAAVGVLLTVGGSPAAALVPAPDVLYLEFDQDSQLYVLSSGGGDRRPVGPEGGFEIEPQGEWSPDGTQIAVAEGLPDAPLRFYSPDGTLLRELPIEGRAVRWSPDGTMLATGGDQTGLLVVDVRTGAARRVTDGGSDADPRWSPDNGRLLFTSSNAPYELRVVDLASGQQELVATEAELAQASEWRWTSDGEMLKVPRDAALSPDGDRRAATCSAGPPGEPFPHCTENLYVDGQRILSEEGGIGGISWTPDGRRLALRGDGIEIVDADGSNRRQLHPTIGIDLEVSPRAPRLAGASRLETAASVSRATHPSASTVVVGRADDYADALAGGPLAGVLGAPLLLTFRDQLPPATTTEIQRLGASEAVILGGPAAVSPGVEQQLRDLGVAPRRVFGRERFSTAAQIAREAVTRGADPDQVMIALGADTEGASGFADALSASSVATALRRPILTVPSDTLPASTAEVLQGMETATVVGGVAAVSGEVESQIDQIGVDTPRVFGNDRYDTSARLLDVAYEQGADPTGVVLATGRDWPDALTAGPAAASQGSALLLTDGAREGLVTAAADALARYRDPLTRVSAIGGPDVLEPDNVVDAVRILTPTPEPSSR